MNKLVHVISQFFNGKIFLKCGCVDNCLWTLESLAKMKEYNKALTAAIKNADATDAFEELSFKCEDHEIFVEKRNTR